MNTTQTKTQNAQRIYPAVRYQDAKAAIAWLTHVLGFEAHEVCPGEGESIAHAELKLGGNLIMLGSVKADPYARSPKDLGGATGSIYIALDTPGGDRRTLFACEGGRRRDRSRTRRYRLRIARVRSARSRRARLEFRNVPPAAVVRALENLRSQRRLGVGRDPATLTQR